MNTTNPSYTPDETPFFERPVEIVQNPYARFDTTFKVEKNLFNLEVMNKYHRATPDYALYPTLSQFTSITDGTEATILANKDPRVPISLYFHMPASALDGKGEYLDYLFKEIRHKKSLLQIGLNGDPIVEQVHFGGGTLTFLSDDELVKLWQFLQTQFTFSDKPTADYALEIDPRELHPKTLEILRNLGFNRLSFGVQDFVENVPEDNLRNVIDEARRLGYRSINIDLIYGLPHQTPVTLRHTVEKIINISPDRLLIFNYAHFPERFKGQRQIDEADLPSPTDKPNFNHSMLGDTVNALSEAGYQYIGIDQFAKPDDELAIAQREGKLHRNFQGYTTQGSSGQTWDLLGFGVSAISQIGDNYLQNSTDLTEYQNAINVKKLPAVKIIHARLPDLLRRYVIMNLLCHDYVDFKDLNVRFSIDPMTYFIREIQALGEMQADKLIDMDAKGIRILPKGRMLARNVAMVFDSYLAQKDGNRFSKVI